MIRKSFLVIALLALSGLLILAACGDDDDDDSGAEETASPEEIAEFEDFATTLVETDHTDEASVDFFLEHVTDEALSYFGYDSPEDCRANAEDCIGSPTEVESISGTEISGDEGRTTVSTSDGDNLTLLVVREDGVWKLKSFAFSAEIPEGSTVIEVSGIDYAFDWNPDDAVAGDVAFAFTNDGTQLHELAVAAVNDDFDIEAVKTFAQESESQEEEPPGVEALIGFGFAAPGLTSNAVLEGPLEPGNYAFLCFLPSPDGTPHVVLNMYSEFTVE